MSQRTQAKVTESHIVEVKAKSGPKMVLFDPLSEGTFMLVLGGFELIANASKSGRLPSKFESQGSPHPPKKEKRNSE